MAIKETLQKIAEKYRWLLGLAIFALTVVYYTVSSSGYVMLVLFSAMLIYALRGSEKAYILRNPFTKFLSGISLEKLCKLSEILQVSTDYLVKGEAEEPKPERSYAEILQANLYTYSEDELQFLVELMNFLRPRATLHGRK